MRQGGGAHWGTPTLVSWTEGKALAASGGNVCVSAVGVCVGAGNGTAFRADLCSLTHVHSVCECEYLHGTGELPGDKVHYIWIPLTTPLTSPLTGFLQFPCL